MAFINGQVGVQSPSFADGQQPIIRLGKQNEMMVSELHGRFYEQTYRGSMFSAGHAGAVALASQNATVTSLAAAAQPILGIWNNSPTMNIEIEQAFLQDFINNVTSVSPGAFVWCWSTGNFAISTGLAPWNRNTMAQAGSVAKVFLGATALTGLTNSLTIVEGADFPLASGLLTTTVAAATPTPSVGGVQNFDGSLILKQGSVLALMNTLSTTTHSVMGRLLWQEVPVI